MEPQDFDNSGEILEYDGYVLSTPWQDAYMLMNDDDIINDEEVAEGKTIHFNVEDGLVSEAMVES